MTEWQFNVLFIVAVGGALFLLLAPAFHIDTGNPTAATGVGAILTFVLTQKREWTKKKRRPDKDE